MMGIRHQLTQKMMFSAKTQLKAVSFAEPYEKYVFTDACILALVTAFQSLLAEVLSQYCRSAFQEW
ncbi:hypothetical protein CI610_02847 [invertebrate metagenome]|uniref:Uncharacterized protein n=1 Tax=invertebrate metagenome TaxID=1711999 RepID=A0A2H9T4T7_9ZZZZ